MTSATKISEGGLFLVVVAIATSRSVIIPTASPFFPRTGRTPQSPSYIFHATSARRSVGLQQIGSRDMISCTLMHVILRHIASSLTRNGKSMEPPPGLPRVVAGSPTDAPAFDRSRYLCRRRTAERLMRTEARVGAQCELRRAWRAQTRNSDPTIPPSAHT